MAAARQTQAHSSHHAPGTNMHVSTPGSTAPAFPWKPIWRPSSRGSKTPAMSWEPTWPAIAPGPQLPPCHGNQHGRQQHQAHGSRHALGNYMAVRQPRDHNVRHALGTKLAGNKPGPTAPAMTWKPTWPTAPPSPQLRSCPGNKHGR